MIFRAELQTGGMVKGGTVKEGETKHTNSTSSPGDERSLALFNLHVAWRCHSLKPAVPNAHNKQVGQSMK